MASHHRTNQGSYRIYGSTAYAPAYEGNAVPKRQGDIQHPIPKVRPKVQRRTLTRTKVKVREAGEVSPFAVIGFFAVGIMAALLIMNYAQYLTVSDQTVSLRDELSELQDQYVTLSAQYEQVFDIEKIQEAVGDTMIRPMNDQIVYLDLSEPDNVVLYGEQETTFGAVGALEGVKEIFSRVFEYFQ